MAAHGPEEIFAAPEELILTSVEHAALDEFVRLAHTEDVFRDPEQRVQIAQAAFAVLDIRLDQITRLTGAAMALLAFGKLGRDELRRSAAHDLPVKPRDKLVEQRTV